MKFIDLYAGIGGIRFAFEQAGAECVFSSEWNKYSQKTYQVFHNETPCGDITNIPIDSIPNHNILAAGFPCQPFSLAGVSKKNSLGRMHGFDDPTQGTEFFKLKEILRIKQPEAFLFENVKNLKTHDKKQTFGVIEKTLDAVGYHFHNKVIDSSYWVPQHRERIYILGFRKDLELEEAIPNLFPANPEKRLVQLGDILESEENIAQKYEDKYTVTKGTWEALKRHKSKHQQKGNGFGFGIIYPPYDGKVTRTLSARYYKDGAEILISQGKGRRPRRLTPLEVFRLQGFPSQFEYLFEGLHAKPVSDNQIYKQFGNSVTVPVVAAIASNMINLLKNIVLKPERISIPFQMTA